MQFEWDGNNLRKIRAHRITQAEVEEAIQNDPLPFYEHDVDGELRIVYYSETVAGRMLAVVVVEHEEAVRVVTAYDLNARQRRQYLQRRFEGE